MSSKGEKVHPEQQGIFAETIGFGIMTKDPVGSTKNLKKIMRKVALASANNTKPLRNRYFG